MNKAPSNKEMHNLCYALEARIRETETELRELNGKANRLSERLSEHQGEVSAWFEDVWQALRELGFDPEATS